MAIAGLDSEQEGNARIVVDVSVTSGIFVAVDYRAAAIIAIATTIVESGIRNLNYGDLDSLGLFQQRAGWGSADQRLDPVYASTSFYQALSNLGDWQSMAPGDAAQAVQVSAFPDRYAEQIGFATTIVDAIGVGTGGGSTVGGGTVSTNLKRIRQQNDYLVAEYNDGTKQMFQRTNTNHFWIPITSVSGSGGGGGGTTPPGGGDGTMIDPFPGHYDASDPFGNLGFGRTYPHTGSDWNGLSEGTPIPAISNGQVVFAGLEPTGGNGWCTCVRMSGVNPEPEFPAGTTIYWAYLHGDGAPHVSAGDLVTKGQAGVMDLDNSGSNSEGNHLHVTLSDSDHAYQGLGNKVDPYAFITARLS